MRRNMSWLAALWAPAVVVVYLGLVACESDGGSQPDAGATDTVATTDTITVPDSVTDAAILPDTATDATTLTDAAADTLADAAVDTSSISDTAADSTTDTPSVTDAASDATSDATADIGPDTIWTDRWLPTDDRVHVFRDKWGVPHVMAATPWGGGYGVGWAQADDQLHKLLRNLWIAQGRLAEIDGASVLNVDRTLRLTRLVPDVEAYWDQYPQEVREVVSGFAAGVNAFMEAHPERVPSWAEPIQPAWPLAFANLLFVSWQIGAANGDRNGLGASLATISFNGIDEFHNTELPAALLPGGDKRGMLDTEEAADALVGSNGWAVAPSRTDEEGVGFFLGDPHMPWNGPWVVWEMHVRAPELEVAGATFPGLPMPVFGRNADIVWTFTMNGLDGGDAFRLTLDPENSERYLLDGEYHDFEMRDEVFHVADGDDVTLRLRWSEHGLVAWHDPVAGYAIAYRLASFGQVGAAEQFLGLAQSQDLDDFEEAMGLLQLGRFNVVAADSSGHILYAWNARMPWRSPDYDYNNLVDGSSSDALWGMDDMVPWESLPKLRDPEVGYVQNCNNSPWNTTYTDEDPDPADYPGYGFPGGGDTERSWRTRQALREGTIDEAFAYSVARENTMLAAPPLLPLLREAWVTWGAEHPDAERLAQVFELWEDWDGEADVRSAAPTAFLLFMFEMFDSLFIPVEPLDWTLTDLDEELGQRMLDAISSGLDIVQEQVGVWRVPWGIIHGITLHGRRFPVATAQYPAVSLFNCNADPVSDPEFKCFIGSSYAFFSRVEHPIRTWSATPLGQSETGDHTYAFEVTKVYANAELKLLAFSDEDLATLDLTETVLEPEPTVR